jgi:hypothetical protein
MERVLDWVPVPQDWEQLEKVDQAESLQAMGQNWVLHWAVSVRPGQALPPWAAARVTVRVRCLEPVPQVLEQLENAPQAETRQSTGQAWALQTRSWVKGQLAPPWAAAVMIFTGRTWVPEPQVLVQVDQSSKVWTQLIGQGWVLQFLGEVRLPQLWPPELGAVTTVRVLDWTPPPHFSVQVE